MIYPKRYIQEPRKRKAYCEACDLIAVYGIERCHWNYRVHGICRTEMKEIWNTASADMNGNSNYDVIYEGRRRKKTS